MQTELRIKLLPKQSLLDRTIETCPNVLYGGARGGGKSMAIRLIMLKRRIQYAGSIGAIFRKTWEEVRDNHLNEIFQQFPALKDRYIAGQKEIRFENGSRLLFRHAKDIKAIEGKQGIEFHDLAIDEVGNWPEQWYELLKASNRSSRPGIKPRCILAGNPGGIGHKWLKRRFVTKQFKNNEHPEDYSFIPAKIYDNSVLMKNDPYYLKNLESISNEVLRKAWLDGDWDIMAGQFFDMVSRETHVVEPFPIPDFWERKGMFDTGYNHPSSFQWMATDTDGNCYIYRELIKSKMRTEEFFAEVMKYPDSKLLRNVPAGWDCWTKHGGAPCVEEKVMQATNHQIILKKAVIDRVAGAQQLRDYLAIRENGKPRLFFFKNCPITFDCITRMTHDNNNPEDVLKVDAIDGDPFTGDDPYDSLRMGLMDRPRISITPKDTRKTERDYFSRYDKEKDDGSWQTV